MSRLYSRGQTLIEYGLLLSLIVIIIITALIFMAPIVNDWFYSPITVEGETYISVAGHERLTLNGDLYVVADLECLDLDGDIINIDDIDYVAVGGSSVEFEGRTYVSAEADCLEELGVEARS